MMKKHSVNKANINEIKNVEEMNKNEEQYQPKPEQV